MKPLSFLLGLFLISAVLFLSCDDDLNTVGTSILPGGDNIDVATDTFQIKIKTVKIDSLYARTSAGLLGKYSDDILGAVKSDFMSEFYCYDAKFEGGENAVIDSVRLNLYFGNHYGDTLAPMGLSVFRLNKELTNMFYTNVDPLDFCNMTDAELIGQQTYSIAQSPFYSSSSTVRIISANIDKKLGEDFYKEYLANKGTFATTDSFRDYFPGVYVTPTFGSGSLVEVELTTLDIHYKYDSTYELEIDSVVGGKDTTYIEVRDTTYVRTLTFTVTDDVLQLNHVENSVPNNILQEGTGSVYIKSPAGVCLEITLPIMDIKAKLGEDSTKTINSANYNLIGYTEKEDAMNIPWGKPSSLLLIDKDSVDTFFKKRQLPNNKNHKIVARSSDPDNNTYNLGNLSNIITEYKNKEGLTEDPTFVLMPVSVTYNSSTYAIERVGTYLRPLTAVIRSDDDYMKLGIIYSKY